MAKRGTDPKARISTARLNRELHTMEDFAKSFMPTKEISQGWLQAVRHMKAWLAKEMME